MQTKWKASLCASLSVVFSATADSLPVDAVWTKFSLRIFASTLAAAGIYFAARTDGTT